LKKSKETKTKVGKTIGIAAVSPRAGQCFPDKVTLLFILRHATRLNIWLSAQ